MLKRTQVRIALTSLLLVAGTASAQYKWIDAQGRIGYGDMIPADNVKILKGPTGYPKRNESIVATADSSLNLPIQLRKITERFPVILYTTTACAPCDMARQHLKRRGVPYSEKTISTGHDLKAFSERGFGPDTNLPLLVVGADKQIGYHALRWDALLSSSGYPKQSRLPAGYKFGDAEALAAAGQIAAPGEDASSGDGFKRGSVLTQSRSGPGGRPAQPEAPTLRF
ncbi:MAG: glutaredoxin family protein [Burkholderiaceae bacterium]